MLVDALNANGVAGVVKINDSHIQQHKFSSRICYLIKLRTQKNF